MKLFLAIDIGASSGRHIVGWQADGEIRTQEVYRFPNGVLESGGSLTWDIDALEAHVRTGIEEALKELGMSRDDVSVEILDMGKTGFLGFGALYCGYRVALVLGLKLFLAGSAVP